MSVNLSKHLEGKDKEGRWTTAEIGAATKYVDEVIAMEELMELDPEEIFEMELHAGHCMKDVLNFRDKNDIRNARTQQEKVEICIRRLLGNAGGYRAMLEFTIHDNLGHSEIARKIAHDEENRQQLTDFYNSAGGNGWTQKDDWNTEELLENWFATTTDGNDLIGFDLTENNVKGVFSPTFGDFEELQHVVLLNNSLTGAIPNTIDGCKVECK